MTRRRVFISLLLLAVIGCSSPVASPSPAASSPTSPSGSAAPSPTASAAPAGALADQIVAEPFGDSTISATVDALAAAGVATFEDAAAEQPMVPVSPPVSPFQLLLDQVESMALEAHYGSGIQGSMLDDLVETPDDLAGPSYILAGYVAAGDTPGAELARQLMGDPDWSQAPLILFPQLVLVLFTSDVAHQREIGGGQPDGSLAALSAPQPAEVEPANMFSGVAAFTPCSTVSDFVSRALTAVFSALRLGEPSNSVARFFVSIWNFVVSVLESVAQAIIKKFNQAVFDEIGKVAAVVGTVATIVSAIRRWTVTIQEQPDYTEKGIPGVLSRQRGYLVARVNLGGMDEWPEWAVDCANRAGKPLPNLKPGGAPIKWSEPIQRPAGLVQENSRSRVLDANGVGRFEFTTLDDEVSDPYQSIPGTIYTHVTIERQSLRDLANLVTGEILAGLPSEVIGPLMTFLGGSIESVLNRLNGLITVQGSGPGVVIFHVDQATPQPVASPAPLPSPDDSFCDLYRDWADWAQRQGDTITRSKAAEIERRFMEMRPYAPPELLKWVDFMIDVYGTFARTPAPYQIPITGQHGLVHLPEALQAMDTYCGDR